MITVDHDSTFSRTSRGLSLSDSVIIGSGEAHRPFGRWAVCTCCLSANFLNFMENQLFALITPLLGQIHGQIGLIINSAGGLGCRFLKFETGVPE